VRKFFIFFVIFIWSNSLFSRGAKVKWEEISWQVLQSEHFDLHYPEHYDELGRTALAYAEEANIYLSEKLEHNLGEVIPIYIYPSHAQFQSTNILSGMIDEGTGGFTESIKKRVVIPFMGSYDELRHVITHELVHAFQYDIFFTFSAQGFFGISSGVKAPLWLMEGSAEYFSLGWDHSVDMVIRDAVINDMVPTIDLLTNMQVSNPYMFYKGGQSICFFISETYGEKKIGEIIKDSRDQESFDAAIKTNLGVTVTELDQQWRLWLKRKFYSDVLKKTSREETMPVNKTGDESEFKPKLFPVISPDGKILVYITFDVFDPVIAMQPYNEDLLKLDYSIDKKENDEEKILLRSGVSRKIYQLHLLDNRISFTSDSQNIFFVAGSQGKDRLYLFNIKKKKIVGEWVPQVDIVQYPRLSNDGNYALFTGTSKGKSDLYYIDLKTNKTKVLTNDFFTEKDAVFSADGTKVYYSSNEREDAVYDNKDYDLFEYDLKNDTRKSLLRFQGVQKYPLYTEGEKLYFISDHTGISNVYILQLSDNSWKQVTDLQNSVLAIEQDSNYKELLFSFFESQNYRTGIMDLKKDKLNITEADKKTTSYSKIDYPSYPPGYKNLSPGPYKLRFSTDMLFFGAQYSSYSRKLGFFYYGIFSEYLGDHWVETYMDFISGDWPNIKVNYIFLKKRTRWNVGFYRAKNFYGILNLADLTTVNNILYNPDQISESINKIGGYVNATYPLTPFISVSAGTEIARYEEIFYKGLPDTYARKDIFTNIYSVNAGILYNNVVYGMESPLTGSHLSLALEQSLNLSGRDYQYTRISLDARKYFFFFNRYIWAVRFFAGSVQGKESTYFPWVLGGYNTIRGYPFLSIKGTQAFLVNLELRYPVIDYIVFGLPVPWVIRGFSGVLFFDSASATDNVQQWRAYNEQSKMTEDLNLSYGLGIRMTFFPGILCKIDWGTPWNLRRSLPISKWQGEFSLGYQF